MISKPPIQQVTAPIRTIAGQPSVSGLIAIHAATGENAIALPKYTCDHFVQRFVYEYPQR